MNDEDFGAALVANNKNLGKLLALPEIIELSMDQKCKWVSNITTVTNKTTITISGVGLDHDGFIFFDIRRTIIVISANGEEIHTMEDKPSTF